MSEVNEKYLAILFFFKDYKGSEKNLPGVENDEKVLKELLSKYEKEVTVTHESKSVLEDLNSIVEALKDRKFERVHFHFSGHGKDSNRVETEEVQNSHGEVVKQAQEPVGECVLGNKLGGKADSIHDLKLELLKLNTEKITMTLDCCRNVTRDATIVDLRDKGKMGVAQHEKMFVFQGTMETQTATDDPGRSFTHFLSSVCRENDGAMDILEIATKVNEKMKEKKMNQRCKVDFVPGTGNWENFMWPHQLDKNVAAPSSPQPSGQSVLAMRNCNNVGGNQEGSFNGATFGSGCQINYSK